MESDFDHPALNAPQREALAKVRELLGEHFDGFVVSAGVGDGNAAFVVVGGGLLQAKGLAQTAGEFLQTELIPAAASAEPI